MQEPLPSGEAMLYLPQKITNVTGHGLCPVFKQALRHPVAAVRTNLPGQRLAHKNQPQVFAQDADEVASSRGQLTIPRRTPSPS